MRYWDTHVFKGMMSDLAASNQPAEYLCDAHNIRIGARIGESGNTITNEKGPLLLQGFDMQGTYMGHCIVNDYVVVFTHTNSNDYIYRLNIALQEIVILFKGNLNFDEEYPLETLGIYETELIQKVYWTDNKNQPRVINIVKDKLLTDRNGSITPYDNNIGYTVSAYGNSVNQEYPDGFNFVNELKLQEQLNVFKEYNTASVFSPGTIQYAITYYNKYGQESNIALVSPIYYKSYKDRGGSPEDRVPNSFRISISNLDLNFDYLRLYSIQRTTKDAVPVVSRVADFDLRDKNNQSEITYLDTGMNNETLDPTFLLYVGGEEILAETFTNKDNVLFLGNYEIKRRAVPQNIKTLVRNLSLSESNRTISANSETSSRGAYYSYASTLDYREGNTLANPTTFKIGEYYRFGLQFQYKNGKWSEPVYIKDDSIDSLGNKPELLDNDNLKLPMMVTSLGNNVITALSNLGYIKVRPVVVVPQIAERRVITQGMLCPTVYNVSSRYNKTPYAQSSWFLRPFPANLQDSDNNNPSTIDLGAAPQWKHKYSLYSFDDRRSEIQGVPKTWGNRFISDTLSFFDFSLTDDNGNNIYPAGYEGVGSNFTSLYGVDQSFITMHSPEIEFDESFSHIHLNTDDIKLQIVGVVPFESSVGDIDITTSTPFIGKSSTGFNHRTLGVTNENADQSDRSLVSGLFYNDFLVDEHGNDDEDPLMPWVKKGTGLVPPGGEINPFLYMVYPWHKSGSLNNDYNRDANNGIRTAKLLQKRISNLKYSRTSNWLSSIIKSTDDSGPTPSQPQERTYQEVQYINSTGQGFFTNQQTEFNITSLDTLELNGITYYIIPISSMFKTSYTGYNYGGEQQEFYIYGVYKYVEGEEDFSDYPNKGYTEYSLNQMYALVNINAVGGADGQWALPQDYPNDFLIANWNGLDGYVVIGRSGDSFVPNWNSWDNAESTGIPSTEKWFVNNWEGHRYTTSVTPDIPSNPYNLTTTSIKYYGESISGQLIRLEDSNTDYNYLGSVDQLVVPIIKYSTIFSSGSTSGVELIQDFPYFQDVNSKLYYFQNDGIHRIDNDSLVTGDGPGDSNAHRALRVSRDLVRIKYKSTPHLVFGFKNNDLQTIAVNKLASTYKSQPFLFLAELYRPDIDLDNLFGGTSDSALQNNLWIPAGEAVPLNSTIQFKYGDTWYQRYDCLKTYPYTDEDENSIVEIGSFMIETRINIDGRYDRNRGQITNMWMTPRNFNLMNPVYSQLDNYFNYRILDKDFYILNKYPNSFLWTLEHQPAAEVDNWTQITLANTFDLDGDKGQITSLNMYNDNIIAFQEKAVSQILYNERVQINASDGNPIEIANNGKVQGRRFINDKIGCLNKYSICNTPTTMYFIDSIEKHLYMLGEQLANSDITDSKNMTLWFKRLTNTKWKANNFTTKVQYDQNMQDLYITTSGESLYFSEKLGGEFVSKLSYPAIPAMFNIKQNNFYILKQNNNTLSLYEMFKGQYNNFFGTFQPYDITFASNGLEGYFDSNRGGYTERNTNTRNLDKIFSNVELRADRWTDEIDGTLAGNSDWLPFDYIKAYNEYQNSDNVPLSWLNCKPTNAKKKFRVWRLNIPRDKVHKLDRIRNTWCKIKLGTDTSIRSNNSGVIQLHDLNTIYYI